MNKIVSLLLVSLSFSIAGFAQLRLPALISNGMVLQQKDSVTLWGWAGPSDIVNITTSWNGQSYKAKANNNAIWKIKVATPIAGGPYDISFKSRNEIVVKDIMIGEVWLCSGQSNMEWSYNNGVKDVAEELSNASNQKIRFFHIAKTGAANPQEDVKAQWTNCDSNTLKGFSAVGYFFGKHLQQNLNVTVGLINASWGGTPADTWTPEPIVDAIPTLKEAASKLKITDWWPTQPGQAYNGMIAPLINYSIAGTIWYQGESNTETNATYRLLFTTMIDSWRAMWNKNFPFYFVQIAPYNYGNNDWGALLQEAQTQAMNHSNTGMVVVTDLIDSVSNIHPSRKRPVGQRLANWALAETYGVKNIDYKSPQFSSMALQGDKISIQFINTGSGLKSTSDPVLGFLISDESGNWFPADVKLDKDKITLSSSKIKKPVNVRYGFGNTLVGSIQSVEGLPLIPFRTDSRK